MNDDQANRFAQRMIETWPNGPRRNIWYDIALKLKDTDAARQAYTDLERTAPHISTAQFHTAYQAAKRRHIVDTHEPGKCELCDDTGWVDDPTYHARHCPRTGPCPCHGVKPCRCTRGQAMKETQRRIHETNNR